MFNKNVAEVWLANVGMKLCCKKSRSILMHTILNTSAVPWCNWSAHVEFVLVNNEQAEDFVIKMHIQNELKQ